MDQSRSEWNFHFKYTIPLTLYYATSFIVFLGLVYLNHSEINGNSLGGASEHNEPQKDQQ